MTAPSAPGANSPMNRSFSCDDVTYAHVRAFIYQADLAKTTRQNRLSHMRKVLEALSIADRERYERHYQGVKSFLRVKVEEGDRDRSDRVKRALKPHEVTRLLDVWRDDRSIQGLRNNAMIRTAGLHRAAALGVGGAALVRCGCGSGHRDGAARQRR